VKSHMANNILKLTGATVYDEACDSPAYSKCMFLVHGFTANGMDVLLPVMSQDELRSNIEKMRTFNTKLASIHIVAKDRLSVIANAMLGDLSADAQGNADHAFPTEHVDIVIADLVKKSVEVDETDSTQIVWYLALNGSRREVHNTKPKSYMKVIGQMYAKRADIFRTLNTLRGLRHSEALDLDLFKEQLTTEPLATSIKTILGPDFRYDDLIGDTLNERAHDLTRRVTKVVIERLAENPFGSLLSALMGGKGILDDLGGDLFGADLDDFGHGKPRQNRDEAPVSDFAKAFADAFKNANGGRSPYDRSVFDRSELDRPLDEMPAFRRTEPAWASSIGR